MSTRYDPQILQQFADKLYSQASSAIILGTIVGVLIGGFLGFQVGNIIAAVIIAILLGALGCAIGMSIAFQFKLRAQSALCQKQIEENTRRPTDGASIAPVVAEPIVRVEKPATDGTIQDYERWKHSKGF